MDASKPKGRRPEPLHVRDDLEVVARRCPFCHESAQEDDVVACARCDARHHAGCWDEHGACSSCGGTERLVREQRTPPRRSAGRRRLLVALALASLASLGVGLVLRVLHARVEAEAEAAKQRGRELREERARELAALQEAEDARRLAEMREAGDGRAELRAYFGADLVAHPRGVELRALSPDGRAARGGLLEGDVIQAVLAGSVDAADVVYPAQTPLDVLEALQRVQETPYVRPLVRVLRGDGTERVSLPR